ncbi:glycerol-3-phosphate dehydrogenase [Vibrio gazogenes]|uniref:Glycerol-3-phosphate dehydrogenase n=1 Tax=Vibrio gazogenes DSM 21264 = NBRC 103151 TaxID=1123492 RepID=A0A1M4Y493_VIBGA|nr:glycerol-3-phosphate dehydrogenase [Vibrio gazogenes]USP12788.1 glycerol-3-phosphate dehydrogenase [Vibrio gazogenes]SHF00403.1 homodimeric glycerol 3-phosphate dehydrogenase (quinone) [Vibrio gazogenes DSM 21264] [Vibrio gazogenes DSM 21264 = NBRC 103151]SJN56236.1 Aerobic glycerol-3-phosphate dehydrogenase [Vibrio gazogenes]
MDVITPNQENRLLDLIIVGGGINGAGIAADAAGRGLSVGLYEAQDFASATSSSSSKLIHGGLRYLEHYEFRLVAEALAEREVLLKKAPHVARPMRFRLPHRPYLRPAWMIRCGLFLYDHLGKRTTLPASHKVNLAKSGLLKPEMKTGFEYSDCWVDDARLVVLNILAAQENGAEVSNYCRVERAVRENDIWRVTIYDQQSDTRFERYAKALVNAAGPWVKQFFDDGLSTASPRNIRLVKGSHIVVPRIHHEEQAYILQNKDNRIVFVIPYMDDFSIIGTTDVEYHGDPRQVEIDDEEQNYLIDIVNQHFVRQLSREDVIWSYSGVRPLCDDESSSPQAVTRDYTIELEQTGDQAPLLSVFGGKLTTYRKLGEAAMNKLEPYFEQMGKSWTANVPLPGGYFSCTREQLGESLRASYPWLSQKQAFRYAVQFGTYTRKMLSDVNRLEDMGRCFAEGVYQREIDYMIDCEFVRTSDDFLWRRTKLGLYLNQGEQQAIAQYITTRCTDTSVTDQFKAG